MKFKPRIFIPCVSFILGCVFLGCASAPPPSVCSEYMGVRRESRNYVFCKAGPIYIKKDKVYKTRTADIELPDVDVAEP